MVLRRVRSVSVLLFCVFVGETHLQGVKPEFEAVVQPMSDRGEHEEVSSPVYSGPEEIAQVESREISECGPNDFGLRDPC